MTKSTHPLTELARASVESFIKNGSKIKKPKSLCPEMKNKAGVFVCLKKEGELRGCIGTFLPITDCVAEEVIRNAISAATEDPRFTPVCEDDLCDLKYTVDVLGAPEPVKSLGELDAKKYGVIVQAGDGRRGLLLPDLEGVDTVERQIYIAKRKAGIEMHEPIAVYRFEVSRYE